MRVCNRNSECAALIISCFWAGNRGRGEGGEEGKVGVEETPSFCCCIFRLLCRRPTSKRTTARFREEAICGAVEYVLSFHFSLHIKFEFFVVQSVLQTPQTVLLYSNAPDTTQTVHVQHSANGNPRISRRLSQITVFCSNHGKIGEKKHGFGGDHQVQCYCEVCVNRTNDHQSAEYHRFADGG